MATATKDAPKTIRVRMLQMMVGYQPTEVIDDLGNITTVPGALYTREVKEIYDVEEKEAQRLIKAGFAVKAD